MGGIRVMPILNIQESTTQQSGNRNRLFNFLRLWLVLVALLC